MKRRGGRPTPEWLLVPGVIESLKAAWAAGTPTAEMGRLFGTSKNAIVGMVHRLDLPARPSPITYSNASRAAPRPYVPPCTLPPLESEPAMVAPRPVIAAPIPIARPIAAPRPLIACAFHSACCWPIGEPGTKTFKFCHAAAEPGAPYCAEHKRRAYVPRRQRAEAMGAD